MHPHLTRWGLPALVLVVAALAGALVRSPTPPASAAPALTIAAGDAHTCALLGDGSARCWGQNYYGQLGDGTTTDRHTPVAVSSLSNAVGGIAELPALTGTSAGEAATSAEGSGWWAGRYVALAAGLAAAIAFAAGAWYAGRRWLR